MNLGSMQFRKSSLAATAMVKHSCNTVVNRIKILVLNSDSEEEFMSNDSDTECRPTRDLPEYDKFSKKLSVT
jgi:hypothetical protein